VTSETRTLIEAGDVVGLEVECPGCHMKIVYPISEWLKIDVQCRNCPKRLFDATSNQQTGQNVYPAIDSLRELAGNLWALSTTRADMHARVRLQVTTTPKPPQ
jgi:hypothetical protein